MAEHSSKRTSSPAHPRRSAADLLDHDRSGIDPDQLPEDEAGDGIREVSPDDAAPAEPADEEEWRDGTGIDDISAPPQPLDFDDGDESHPEGPRVERNGTWDDHGADSGELKPPAELNSDRRAAKRRGPGQS